MPDDPLALPSSEPVEKLASTTEALWNSWYEWVTTHLGRDPERAAPQPARLPILRLRAAASIARLTLPAPLGLGARYRGLRTSTLSGEARTPGCRAWAPLWSQLVWKSGGLASPHVRRQVCESLLTVCFTPPLYSWSGGFSRLPSCES